MKRIARLSALVWVALAFVGGAVNLYPCALGASVSQAKSQKSCHKTVKDDTTPKESKKEKSCCVLHCYNPTIAEPLVKIHPPTITRIAIDTESISFFSITISPPFPPPRQI